MAKRLSALELSLRVSIFFTLFSFSLCLLPHHDDAKVKGMFVFGSSLVDNGNNNYLRNSKARANYPPYGIDFPLGPSGRFSNGRNPIDVLGELLKLPTFIPPFADPKTRGRRIVQGVNFASGGSGILDQTGAISGEVLSLNKQIEQFEKITLPELKDQLGVNNKHIITNQQLSDYLFVIGTGGNDYLLNYFLQDQEQRSSLPLFTTNLISVLTTQLKTLYGLGARKFVLFSIQAIGCIPVVKENLPAANGSCVEAINEAALLFNSHLEALAKYSNKSMPHSRLVYVNSYKIIRDIIDNPVQYGFSDTSKACCKVKSLKENGDGILCEIKGKACVDRTAHVYFDGLHPTDAINERIAIKAYSSTLHEEAYPINVQQLASI